MSIGHYKLFEEMCDTNELPLSLHRLLNSLTQNEVESHADFLAALIYYIFLESGFVPITLPPEQRSKIRTHWGYSFVAQIPHYSCLIAANEIIEQNRKCETPALEYIGFRQFKLNMLGHSDTEMQLTIRRVFGGSVICVSFCAGQAELTKTVALSVNQFVSENEPLNINLIAQNPKMYFPDVRNLNRYVKALIAPLRNVVMYESGYPNAALHGMPKEVLSVLFSYFRTDLKTLQFISQTCVYLRNVAISFLEESKIQLKHRRPTPMIYDPSDHINRPYSRYRIVDMPELFYQYHPHIYFQPNR